MATTSSSTPTSTSFTHIATPRPQHRDNVLMCIDHGKAVRCDTPFTVNARETAQIVEAAQKKGIFVMEAMWTRFLPTIRKVRSWIDDGAIGDVKMLNVSFGFKAPWNPEWRMRNKELGANRDNRRRRVVLRAVRLRR